MVKLLSLMAISGGVATTSAKGGIRLQSIAKRNTHHLDHMTTEDLEVATRQFVESNINQIQIMNNRYHDDKGSRRLDSQQPSTRDERTSKQHVMLDSHVSNNLSSGKSGKDSSTVAGINSEECFYLLPLACPSKCISSYVSKESEMTDSVEDCNELDTTQMWLVRSDSSYVMIESYDCPGMCIAVDYEMGDDDKMIEETCFNGELMLKDCNSEYGTEWYFTGGQLINSFCWGMGTSSVMTIFMNNGVCESSVAVFGLNEEAIMKADTFMFVNRLPSSPHFTQSVEDDCDDDMVSKVEEGDDGGDDDDDDEYEEMEKANEKKDDGKEKEIEK